MSVPLIEFHQASMARGGQVVLKDLDFTIAPGEHIAILGPNGAGKSSLMRLFTREDYPVHREGSEPSLRILGRERWDVFELRHHLGVVSADLHHAFTDGHGFGQITGLDVALSGFFASLGLFSHQEVTPAMRAEAERALRQVGADHLARKRMDHLSSGEARRVLIARALAPDPAALLLDEPTTGLDLPSRHHFLEMLRGLARCGKTLVLVTHHVEEILPEIERVILLKEGRIFADGPTDQILSSRYLSDLFEIPVIHARTLGWHEVRIERA